MFEGWKDVEKEQVIYVLSELKTLFSDKDKWIDWPEAVDEHGTTIDALDEKAKKFSLMGASFKIACSKYKVPLANYIDVAAREYINNLANNAPGLMLSYDDEMTGITLALADLQKD